MDFIASITVIFLLTAFVKYITVLTAFKYGLGLKSFSFSIVIFIFSVLLSIFSISAYLNDSEERAILLIGEEKVNQSKLFDKMGPYLEANTNKDLKLKFLEINKELKQKANIDSDIDSNTVSNPDTIVTLFAFSLTQLNEAFKIAFIILLPFLLIDLLVIHTLKLLAINSYDPCILALPIKLILLYSINGFTLIGEKLLNGVL